MLHARPTPSVSPSASAIALAGQPGQVMASLDSAGLRSELFAVLFALFVGLLLSSFVAVVRAVCAAAREAWLRSTCAVVRFAGSGTRRAGDRGIRVYS